jgi:hypothetical protein
MEVSTKTGRLVHRTRARNASTSCSVFPFAPTLHPFLKSPTVGCPASLHVRFADIASHRSQIPFLFVVGFRRSESKCRHRNTIPCAARVIFGNSSCEHHSPLSRTSSRASQHNLARRGRATPVRVHQRARVPCHLSDHDLEAHRWNVTQPPRGILTDLQYRHPVLPQAQVWTVSSEPKLHCT